MGNEPAAGPKDTSEPKSTRGAERGRDAKEFRQQIAVLREMAASREGDKLAHSRRHF
jgi:hypothetical protein